MIKEDDAQKNIGLSHHSSPTTDYWRGQTSIYKSRSHSVAYTESLFVRFPEPQLYLLIKNNEKKETDTCDNDLWVSPIHFPLESSTKDNDLAYFDRLLDQFREVKKNNEHIIIGSHPDVDQTILRQLIEREGFEDLWHATILDVVKRTKSINDDIIFSGYRNGVALLVSQEGLSDVAIKHFESDGNLKETYHQLMPGYAREISEPAEEESVDIVPSNTIKFTLKKRIRRLLPYLSDTWFQFHKDYKNKVQARRIKK